MLDSMGGEQMPTITPKLGLKKPLGSEYVSRMNYNENLDLTDQKAAAQTDLDTHKADQSNPHAVTAAQTGATPVAHVGSGGAAHALAVAGVAAGFMSGADKSNLDSLASGNTLPVGVIVMWSGLATAIPAGWHLCDGLAGTPDLRDRFIVGAGSTYAVGATGGAASVALAAAEMPIHNHGASSGSAGTHNHDILNPGASGFLVYGVATGGNEGASTNSTVISNAGAHSHTITVGNTGGSGAHENRPPYYALCLIMKL